MAECPPREGQEVIDLSGKFVMPGLIDAHLHTGMSGEPDTTQCMYYQRDGELALISMLNAQQDLLAGFTTVRDEGSFHFIDLDLKKMIDSGRVFGPRMFVSGCRSPPREATATAFKPGITGGAWPLSSTAPTSAAPPRVPYKYGVDT